MRLLWVNLCLLAVGCVPVYPDRRTICTPTNTTPPLGETFDAKQCGSISGLVNWTGEVPKFSDVTGGVTVKGQYQFKPFPAPFALKLNQSRGIANVQVSLVQVDTTKSKPWALPPVQVVCRDGLIQLEQGATRGTGFIRLGDEVTFHNLDTIPHNVRARGAAFFGLPLPTGSTPLARKFEKLGLVEITSGMGYFWTSAELHVVEHPYYTLTDAEGRFQLKDVPPGKYEVQFRLNNWQVTGQERDPETGLIFRQSYAPAFEKKGTVEVQAGRGAELGMTLPK